MFGGYSDWPKNRTDVDFPQIANTAVLQFGESIIFTFSVIQCSRNGGMVG